MKSNNTSDSPISPRLQIFHALQSLFTTYTRQRCLYVSAQDRSLWLLMIRPQSSTGLYDFEKYFGRIDERDAWVQANLDRSLKERKAHRDRFGGSVDFYAPVQREGVCSGMLISGTFREKCWTADELRKRWKEISGVEGSELNADFMRFVQVALEIPVLDEKGMDGYARLMTLMARWLAGEEDADMLGETDRLRKEVFSPRLPHPNWVDWVVGNDKFQAKGENNRTLSSWEREEMGVTRPPSAVIALMLQSSGRRSGLVEEVCRAREFQHECFLAARRKPECVAGPLGDYGSVILTSYRPGATTAQARLEVREKIRTFREELEKRFGMTVLAGAGFLRAGSLDLARSYREAVAGLHLAVQAGRNPTFVEATVNEREGVPTAGLRASVRELADAMSRASQDRLAISRDKFIRQVLFASHGQSEVARIHCLSALYILLERFEGKSGVSLNAARTLGDDLADRVASAGNLPDLMAAFTGAMEALERYQEKPREAGTAARVEQVLKDIELEPGKPWKLHEICKRTGMSTPTFLKWFRKLTGSGFGPYLRKARLTKARQMLQEGPLTLERIAQECGFNSASYLIQAFKRTMGTSPRKYKHSKTGV